MKRYIEIVDVDDNGKKTVVSSKEEKKFSPKTAIADFQTNHPKVTKVVKVIGLVTAAAGVAAVGISIGKSKSKESEDALLSDEDMKLLANPEPETETVSEAESEEISE